MRDDQGPHVGRLTHRVVAGDLATRWANDVPVLATPVLLWLGEVACMRAVEGLLEGDEMTVGCGHDMEHLAPTPAGFVVEVEARLRERSGGVLSFDVEARDGLDTVLRGRHRRAVVRRSRFLERVAAKDARTSPAGGGRA